MLLFSLPWLQVLCCTFFSPLQKEHQGIPRRSTARTGWGAWTRGSLDQEEPVRKPNYDSSEALMRCNHNGKKQQLLQKVIVVGGQGRGIQMLNSRSVDGSALPSCWHSWPCCQSFCLQVLGFIRETDIHFPYTSAKATLVSSAFFKTHFI